MTIERTEIWLERLRLETARRDKLGELMASYDRDIHRPAMQALRVRCAAIGHRPQTPYSDNGLGWTWRYCNQCGSRVEITDHWEC